MWFMLALLISELFFTRNIRCAKELPSARGIWLLSWVFWNSSSLVTCVQPVAPVTVTVDSTLRIQSYFYCFLVLCFVFWRSHFLRKTLRIWSTVENPTNFKQRAVAEIPTFRHFRAHLLKVRNKTRLYRKSQPFLYAVYRYRHFDLMLVRGLQ